MTSWIPVKFQFHSHVFVEKRKKCCFACFCFLCWHLTISTLKCAFLVCARACGCFAHPVITSGPFLLFLSSPLANTTHGARTDDTFAGLHLAYEVKKLMYASTFYFIFHYSGYICLFFSLFGMFWIIVLLYQLVTTTLIYYIILLAL